MGTVKLDRPLEVHQHPAVCSMRYRSDGDVNMDAFISWVENSLSNRFHIDVASFDNGEFELDVHYVARGAWPNDITRQFDKMPMWEHINDHGDEDHHLRRQLCGHTSSTADCDMDNATAGVLVGEELASLRR